MSLIVYTGPMFSGKTTAMLQEIAKYTDISEKHKALIINHAWDNRNIKDIVSSHSSTYKGLSHKVDVVSTTTLDSVNVDNYIVIGIDESNFFQDLYPTVKQWINSGKHIICVGLDGNYKMDKFGYISELLHLSDKFTKLSAICSLCLNELTENNQTITPFNTTPAPFTKRITIGDNEIDIGGSDKYIAVCRDHHK